MDRIKGTAQRVLEVELEETEMWSALCELDIECCVSCYNPRYIAQALASFLTAEADEKDEGNDEGAVLKGGRDGRPESAVCFTTLVIVYFTLTGRQTPQNPPKVAPQSGEDETPGKATPHGIFISISPFEIRSRTSAA